MCLAWGDAPRRPGGALDEKCAYILRGDNLAVHWVEHHINGERSLGAAGKVVPKLGERRILKDNASGRVKEIEAGKTAEIV